MVVAWFFLLLSSLEAAGMLERSNTQSTLHHICYSLLQTAQLQPIPVFTCFSPHSVGKPEAELTAQSGTEPHRKATPKTSVSSPTGMACEKETAALWVRQMSCGNSTNHGDVRWFLLLTGSLYHFRICLFFCKETKPIYSTAYHVIVHLWNGSFLWAQCDKILMADFQWPRHQETEWMPGQRRGLQGQQSKQACPLADYMLEEEVCWVVCLHWASSIIQHCRRENTLEGKEPRACIVWSVPSNFRVPDLYTADDRYLLCLHQSWAMDETVGKRTLCKHCVHSIPFIAFLAFIIVCILFLLLPYLILLQ